MNFTYTHSVLSKYIWSVRYKSSSAPRTLMSTTLR